MAIEVTNVSPHGLWLLVEQHEYFVPFKDFPLADSSRRVAGASIVYS
jgi:hypothetical protein